VTGATEVGWTNALWPQRFFFTFVSTEDPEALANLKTKERVQLQIATSETATSLRELQSRHVSHLVTVSGIIISASSIQSKASKLFCRCTTCGDVQEIDVKLGMGGAKLPRTCPGSRESGCALDPYTIDPDLCTYQDVQKFKLQELPEAVPTGEMPRNILLAADRALVGTAIPGTRVTVTGVYSVVAPQGRGGDRGGSTVSQPYLRVVGVNVDAEGRRLQQPEFSKQEEENFIAMSRDRDIYDKIGQSIAPAIYGSCMAFLVPTHSPRGR
jgi:DNA replication licensing factor MCM5